MKSIPALLIFVAYFDNLANAVVTDRPNIVTSDHGMPFPRIKGYAYHDSNHVPLAVRWPNGVRSPGRAIEDFVDFTDIAATILDYAGIAGDDSGMMPVTDKSWRPILESTQAGRIGAERDHVLIGKERTDVGRPHNWGYPIRGIVTAEHLYLHNYEPTRWPADELDDLRADRDCVRNIAAVPALAEHATALRQRQETMLKAQGDPRMDGRGTVFDNDTPTNGDGFYEKFMRGEKVNAGWVEPTDFEKQPFPSIRP